MNNSKPEPTTHNEYPTKGPWKFRVVYGENSTNRVALLLETEIRPVPHNDPVIMAVREDWMGGGFEFTPNGRLIESAPLLLTALEQISGQLRNIEMVDDGAVASIKRLAKGAREIAGAALALIHAAEGEAQDSPPKTRARTEEGWVIELAASSPAEPSYWAGSSLWVGDHTKALRFARQQDAEQAAFFMLDGMNIRICEHGWDSEG
jgi:hypothetical protein